MSNFDPHLWFLLPGVARFDVEVLSSAIISVMVCHCQLDIHCIIYLFRYTIVCSSILRAILVPEEPPHNQFLNTIFGSPTGIKCPRRYRTLNVSKSSPSSGQCTLTRPAESGRGFPSSSCATRSALIETRSSIDKGTDAICLEEIRFIVTLTNRSWTASPFAYG